MSREPQPGANGAPRRLVAGALVVNVVLLVAAGMVYLRSHSQLVLAQGSDSLFDLAAGGILFVSAWVGSQPRDANHPYGHDRAEPLGALITAVLAGVLAFEVLRSAAAESPAHMRFYLGYAGWGPGQLEWEMAQGAWIVAPFDGNALFHSDEGSMWEEAVRSVGIYPTTLVSTQGVH